jgi:aryl-alcohol dehydrogenase-like predicted oxidoreductase
MEYRILGRTGVQVSQLCFGTMSFGGDADEPASAKMFRACRDAGINFFDSADQYNNGAESATTSSSPPSASTRWAPIATRGAAPGATSRAQSRRA